MELWIEYFARHGLPVIRPQEQESFLDLSFSLWIPPSPPVEHRVWAFFLMNNQHLVVDLEEQINEWCDGLLVTQNSIPSLNEQRDIVFGHLPYLQHLWTSWQNQSHLFTSSLGNGPTAHRLSFAPEQIHP